MSKKKELDKPRKVRTTLEELEVLARLKNTVEWAILKRVMQRYLTNLTKISYNLSYGSDSVQFMNRHRGLTGEGRGLKYVVKLVEGAGKKLDKEDEKQSK